MTGFLGKVLRKTGKALEGSADTADNIIGKAVDVGSRTAKSAVEAGSNLRDAAVDRAPSIPKIGSRRAAGGMPDTKNREQSDGAGTSPDRQGGAFNHGIRDGKAQPSTRGAMPKSMPLGSRMPSRTAGTPNRDTAADRQQKTAGQPAESGGGKAGPNVSDLVDEGKKLMSLNRDEEAIRCFDRAIELRPDFAYAHGLKGISLAKLDRDEEAIRCFDRAIELSPDDANAHGLKGKSLYDLGRHEEAIRCCDRVIELSPDDADAYELKGESLSDLGRHEEAIRCFDRVIELWPDRAAAYRLKGISLSALGRREESARYLAKYEVMTGRR